jgi:hypothetical protein
MKFIQFFPVAVAFLVAMPASRSATLASDQFIYSDGDLNGQNGGSGWNGAWFGAGDFVFHPGLSYSDGTRVLDAAGGGVQLTGAASGELRDVSLNLQLASTLYISFICQVTKGGEVGLALNSGPNGHPPVFVIGRLPESPNWGMREVGGPSSVSSVSTTVQSLLVLRIDIAAKGVDTFRLYINPSLSAEPIAADASFTTNDGAFNISQVQIEDLASAGPVSAVFDELRFGTTYADVTPGNVPEPSILLLSIIGLTTVLCASRTKVRRS